MGIFSGMQKIEQEKKLYFRRRASGTEFYLRPGKLKMLPLWTSHDPICGGGSVFSRDPGHDSYWPEQARHQGAVHGL
jgi:hypothetical protein